MGAYNRGESSQLLSSSYIVSRRPTTLRTGFCVITVVAAVLLPFSGGFSVESPVAHASPARANVEQFSRTGMEFVSQGRLEEAIQVFELGLRLDASNPTLLNAVGAAYNLEGNTREAEGYFLKALSADPKFSPARKNLAITYFERGEDGLAVPQFQELSRDPKSRPVAFLFLGMIAERRNQYEDAANLFEKSGQLVFQYPQALVSFASSLGRLRNTEREQLLLDRLSALRNVRADDWFQAGVLYSELDQYQHALDFYDKAQAINPQLTAVDYQRALALDKLGRSREALEILQRVGPEKPNPSSLSLLAHVAENAGNIDLAIESFRRAAEMEPDNENNYLDYGTLCMNYKNYPLALEAVEVGLFYVPKSYRLRVQRGAVLAELGKLAEAEQEFRAAQKLQADDREALLSLARVQVRNGQFEDSVKTLALTTLNYPNDYYVQYYYAFVLLELTKRQGLKEENSEKALQALHRSIRLNSNFPKSYFLLGKIYQNRDPQLAVKQFETCLRLDPQGDSAKYQLGRLLLRMGKREEGEKLLAQVNEQELQEEKEENKSRIQLVRR